MEKMSKAQSRAMETLAGETGWARRGTIQQKTMDVLLRMGLVEAKRDTDIHVTLYRVAPETGTDETWRDREAAQDAYHAAAWGRPVAVACEVFPPRDAAMEAEGLVSGDVPEVTTDCEVVSVGADTVITGDVLWIGNFHYEVTAVKPMVTGATMITIDTGYSQCLSSESNVWISVRPRGTGVPTPMGKAVTAQAGRDHECATETIDAVDRVTATLGESGRCGGCGADGAVHDAGCLVEGAPMPVGDDLGPVVIREARRGAGYAIPRGVACGECGIMPHDLHCSTGIEQEQERTGVHAACGALLADHCPNGSDHCPGEACDCAPIPTANDVAAMTGDPVAWFDGLVTVVPERRAPGYVIDFSDPPRIPRVDLVDGRAVLSTPVYRVTGHGDRDHHLVGSDPVTVTLRPVSGGMEWTYDRADVYRVGGGPLVTGDDVATLLTPEEAVAAVVAALPWSARGRKRKINGGSRRRNGGN
jgi:hypothetical protein